MNNKSIDKINNSDFKQYLPILRRKNATIQYVECDSRECIIKYNTGGRGEYHQKIKRKKLQKF